MRYYPAAMRRGPTEDETCRDVVLPALAASGWEPEQIRARYPLVASRVVSLGGVSRELGDGRADYVLEIVPGLPVASLEAKRSLRAAADGLQQSVRYAQQLDVPTASATNGSGIVERDLSTGRESDLPAYPTPVEAWARYVDHHGLADDAQDGLRQPFNRERRTAALEVMTPRWYQTVAIHRALRAMLAGEDRLLLLMATGTGKTFTAMWARTSSRPSAPTRSSACAAPSGWGVTSRDVPGPQRRRRRRPALPRLPGRLLRPGRRRRAPPGQRLGGVELARGAGALRPGRAAGPDRHAAAERRRRHLPLLRRAAVRVLAPPGHRGRFPGALPRAARGAQPRRGRVAAGAGAGRPLRRPHPGRSVHDEGLRARGLAPRAHPADGPAPLAVAPPRPHGPGHRCQDVEHAEQVRAALVEQNPDLVLADPEWVVRIVGVENEKERRPRLCRWCRCRAWARRWRPPGSWAAPEGSTRASTTCSSGCTPPEVYLRDRHSQTSKVSVEFGDT